MSDRLDTTNRLMAVIDDPDAAARAVDQLRAVCGADSAVALVGEDGVQHLDRSGKRGGARTRVARLMAYIFADQSVDLATYEAALHDGRAVVAVRARGAEKDAALRCLLDAGAHFVNWYGPMATEDIVPWRGPQLPLPFHFHR